MIGIKVNEGIGRQTAFARGCKCLSDCFDVQLYTN